MFKRDATHLDIELADARFVLYMNATYPGLPFGMTSIGVIPNEVRNLTFIDGK